MASDNIVGVYIICFFTLAYLNIIFATNNFHKSEHLDKKKLMSNHPPSQAWLRL